MNSHSTPQLSAVTQSEGAPASRPSFPFPIMFAVWLLVFMTTTLVTFMLPESFSSTTRIKIERDQTDIAAMAERRGIGGYDPYYIQTEFELIQSELVLGKAIDDLDLNKDWGKRYANGDRLKTPETTALLKSRMDLRPVRNTSLIAITVYSETADEAAKIANAVAQAYHRYRLEERMRKISASVSALEEAYEESNVKLRSIRAEIAEFSHAQSTQDTNRLDEARRRLDDLQRFTSVLFTKLAYEKTDAHLPATSMVQIVDTAVPGKSPVRPNKPFNLFVGLVVGCIGGLFLATLIYVLQRRSFRRKSGVLRTQFPPLFRAIVHILIALVVGVVIGYHCANPLDLSTIIVVPLSLLLGGIASAYIELANPGLTPASTATPDHTEPNDAALS